MKKRIQWRNGLPAKLFYLLAICLSLVITQCSNESTGQVLIQNPLPYPENALEPYISARTLSFHYGKHYASYVKNANDLIKNSPFNGKNSEDVIRLSSGKAEYEALFNQTAQAWNHAFFWDCMKPQGGGAPTGDLLKAIETSFGSFDQFKNEFHSASKNLFGSGWVWLVQDKGKLAITTTTNADTPLAHGMKPLFTVDVWEHAYYLDYQNKRVDFVQAVLEHTANWDHAAALMGNGSGAN
ncbi:MAG: superoxide dismutase [Proteobacteria bacterium]|nr:superoxide dismutase [Pseudomonadota bacterium]